MHYLAVLDYQNLDNPLFLKSFAEAARQIKAGKAIIIHGDSDYTERLIQTGMMREDAQVRSIQDLNHRLVSFFADYGLPCIGINGFQRGTVKKGIDGKVIINKPYIDSLPEGTIVLLSNLVQGPADARQVLPLNELTKLVQDAFNPAGTHVFSVDTADEIIVNRDSFDENVTKWAKINGSKLESRIPAEMMDSSLTISISKPLLNNNLNTFSAVTTLS